MTDSQSRAWLRQQAYRFPSQVNEPWEPFRNQGQIGDPIAVGCSITYGVGVAIDQLIKLGMHRLNDTTALHNQPHH